VVGLGPPSDSNDGSGNAVLGGRGPSFLAANLNQNASHNNKGRRRQRSVAVANLKKGTGALLTSVRKTAVGF
jgi:hypothetical protein